MASLTIRGRQVRAAAGVPGRESTTWSTSVRATSPRPSSPHAAPTRTCQQDSRQFQPTVPGQASPGSPAATLAELARMWSPPRALRVVFNQVDDDIPIDRTFETGFAYLQTEGLPHAPTWRRASFNEVYALVRTVRSVAGRTGGGTARYRRFIARLDRKDKLALAHCPAVTVLPVVLCRNSTRFAALQLKQVPSSQQPGPQPHELQPQYDARSAYRRGPRRGREPIRQVEAAGASARPVATGPGRCAQRACGPALPSEAQVAALTEASVQGGGTSRTHRRGGEAIRRRRRGAPWPTLRASRSGAECLGAYAAAPEDHR